tara:strand:+ start:509 stop:775 length:267 start_codon:yes stop_codon:yes gene_type:complete
MKKKFKNTFVGKLVKGLVREGLQTIPVVGTFVTAFKEDTPENPQGTIKLSKWHIYRLVIGVGVGIFLAKGILTPEQVEMILEVIGISL